MSAIDLSSIDRTMFSVSEREMDFGSVILISPKKNKHKWKNEELHLRSVLCHQDGRIISSGFHKFFNYGEQEDHDATTRQTILDGNVSFVEKLDGSLLIRFVEDGKVYLRTRGSHNTGSFTEDIMEMVNESYPKLMDPELGGDASYLFEYCSPKNRIVLAYDSPTLYLLGKMERNGTFTSNKDMARMFETSYPKLYKFEDLGSARELIKTWKGAEGVVIWATTKNGMHFAKIKAEEYCKIHSLKFNLNERRLKMLMHSEGIYTEESLRSYLYSKGFDWESVDFVLPSFREVMAFRVAVSNEVELLISKLEEQSISELSGKRRAVMVKRICSHHKKSRKATAFCFLYLKDNDWEKYVEAWKNGVTVSQFSSWIASSEEYKESLSQRYASKE